MLSQASRQAVLDVSRSGMVFCSQYPKLLGSAGVPEPKAGQEQVQIFRVRQCM